MPPRLSLFVNTKADNAIWFNYYCTKKSFSIFICSALIQQGAAVRVPMSSSRRSSMGMRFDRDREREQRDKDRDMRERERRDQRRDKSSSKRPRSPSNHRSHSPSQRARSPKRRRGNPRVVPRYVVQIPKLSLET